MNLAGYVEHPNVAAFLRVIRAGESSQDPSAYWTMFGGKLADSLADHPRQKNSAAGLTSTAAGAYQFLSKTWDECAKSLDLPDFGPASQDLAAVFLIKRRGALDDVLAGRIEQAISKCAKEWASFPGSPYGQPTKTMAQLLAVYRRYGGALATDAPPAPETPAAADPSQPAAPSHYMPPGEAPEWVPPTPPPEKSMPIAPIIAALLPSIIEAIPKLGRVFGSGSEVAERNIKAAELVVETVKSATGAVNAQDAVERLRADPVAVQAATKAIDGIWFDLTEAGGGGVDGARKADAAQRQAGDLLHSASFWVGLMLVPLVYLLVLSLIGMIGTATWSDDVRAGLAGSLISAIIGGLVGYYFGQTTSRNRAPAP